MVKVDKYVVSRGVEGGHSKLVAIVEGLFKIGGNGAVYPTGVGRTIRSFRANREVVGLPLYVFSFVGVRRSIACGVVAV